MPAGLISFALVPCREGSERGATLGGRRRREVDDPTRGCANRVIVRWIGTDIYWEAIDMVTLKWLLASWLAVAVVCAGAQPAQAEPLTPLNPAELQYLDKLHQVFSISHDPLGFRSDGELLDRGRYVCTRRDLGSVGQAAIQQPPAISQLAFIYLCPK